MLIAAFAPFPSPARYRRPHCVCVCVSWYRNGRARFISHIFAIFRKIVIAANQSQSGMKWLNYTPFDGLIVVLTNSILSTTVCARKIFASTDRQQSSKRIETNVFDFVAKSIHHILSETLRLCAHLVDVCVCLTRAHVNLLFMHRSCQTIFQFVLHIFRMSVRLFGRRVRLRVHKFSIRYFFLSIIFFRWRWILQVTKRMLLCKKKY